MIKPTKYPDWAVNSDGTDNDVTDGTTGENNVEEPSSGKKALGWEYNEKPPRQYFNWLLRLITQWVRYLDKGGIPDNYISGFETENVFSSIQQINFKGGVCKDAGNELEIKTDTSTIKEINSNWEEGNGNGGFPSSLTLTNDTFYFTFVIYNEALNKVDFGFDSELDAVNLLSDSGYSHYRRLGSVLYNTSWEIEEFIQHGNSFFWKNTLSEILDLNSVPTPISPGTNGVLTGSKKVIPSALQGEIYDLYCQLSEPENDDGGSGIRCALWPAGTPLDITGEISDIFYDAKENHGSGLMIKPLHNFSTNDFLMIITDRQSSISNNITYYVYGFKDSRGKK